MKAMLCTQCGNIAKPKYITKGSIWIEILLWLLLFPIGICYSVWRMASRYKGCNKCGGATLIPTDSPMARKFMSTLAALLAFVLSEVTFAQTTQPTLESQVLADLKAREVELTTEISMLNSAKIDDKLSFWEIGEETVQGKPKYNCSLAYKNTVLTLDKMRLSAIKKMENFLGNGFTIQQGCILVKGDRKLYPIIPHAGMTKLDIEGFFASKHGKKIVNNNPTVGQREDEVWQTEEGRWVVKYGKDDVVLPYKTHYVDFNVMTAFGCSFPDDVDKKYLFPENGLRQPFERKAIPDLGVWGGGMYYFGAVPWGLFPLYDDEEILSITKSDVPPDEIQGGIGGGYLTNDKVKGGPVFVRAYTRKDGTFVNAYTRRSPSRRK